MVHEKAWKSVTKAVQLDPKFIGPKYEKIGWVKKKHTWNICKCINLARDLVFYDDIELLDADLKLIYGDRRRKNWREVLRNNYLIQHIEEAEAFIRLIAAGIIFKLKNLTFVDTYGLDLSTVQNLSLLVQSVKDNIDLNFALKRTSRDFPKSKIFNHVNCKSISITTHRSRNTGNYTDADIESLTEALNDRVVRFSRNGPGSFLPFIEKYDGKGKCHEIMVSVSDYREESKKVRKQFCLEVEKIKEWATSRGWEINVQKDKHDVIIQAHRPCHRI